MADDTYYITTHEAALAVVATLMKKSRLRLDTLIITSVLGGMLFSLGGMMHVLVQAGFQGLFFTNPAVVQLLQGSVYPIGLFYVVIMGTDLYNSNILFFTVGVLRGAVSVLDLLISWSFSFMFNLLGNLFVVYMFCHLLKSTTDQDWVDASIQLVDHKLSFSFGENLLKGIPCNFLVATLIYLQLMVKPLHVKFLMMFTPVFVFVSMGYNHVVADMFIIPLGLFNGAPHSVGKYIWRSMIPSLIGNAIGGAAFGILIPWYLHLFVVEMDKKNLNLPEYEERDEQPELGMDSRVVRVASQDYKLSSSSDENSVSNDEKIQSDELEPVAYDPIDRTLSRRSLLSARSTSALSRAYTRDSSPNLRLVKTINSAENMRSPKGVFPVFGMGAPYKKERQISNASYATRRSSEVDPQERIDDELDDDDSEVQDYEPNSYDPETGKISGNIRRMLSRQLTKSDVESANHRASHESHRPSFYSVGSSHANNNYYNISRRASQAGLTRNSVRMSDDIAGIHPDSINVDHSRTVDALRHRALSSSLRSIRSARLLSTSSNSDDVHEEVDSIDSQAPNNDH